MAEDVRRLFRRAAEDFGRRVYNVKDDQWDAPTPCTEWNVRALVNHLVYEMRWAPPLFAGKTVAEVGDRFDGDLLGDDPVASWDAASREAVGAVAREGVLENTVHASFGDISGEEYVSQLTNDHVIHAWDLARATGSPEQLPAELVDFCYRYLEPRYQRWGDVGVFGEAVEPPPGADMQTRLLAMAGRRA